MGEPIAATILILEDDAGVAQLERRRLERAGHRVEHAASAEAARSILARGSVDLLVLDYQLNGEATGLEVHRELQASGLNVPSMLVTAYSDETMLAEAIRSGIRDFLPKNESFLDYLAPAVERILKQVQVERQLAEERANVAREQAARALAEAEKQAMAQEDRRKDEFLAMLAHELRNPLSAISSAVHLARTVPTTEQVAWSVDVITRQAGHLSHLIEDLLDVSRIRLGKIQLRKRALDLADLIPQAIESVRPLIERKKHTLEVDLGPAPLPVEADPTRLEQVFVNLLTNAAKYTDEGGRIRVSVANQGGEVVAQVTDSGEGIGPEMLPRIFDLFIQVNGSIDRAQGGLGIGLTLVRTLVAMHGGSIAASSPGLKKGSTFTVRLPLSAREADARPEAETAGSPRKGRRVLVVDDNADTARGMARLLRASGHAVEVVHDGPAALDAARAFGPDVVLLDIGLPGMDGYEVASRLRSEGFAAATILALSGYGQDEDRRKSLAAGFNAHLVKPIDHDVLLTMIAG